MTPDEAAWVLNHVHRTYHRGGANRTLPWGNPMHLTFGPCPCEWVCDDCERGRCKRNPKACAEVWNASWAELRRLPRCETQLAHPSPEAGHVDRSEDVWVVGCCGRFVCKCACWRGASAVVAEPVQGALFDLT